MNLKFLQWGLLALWLAIPFFIYFFPMHNFEGAMDICLSKVFFNMECLGCGLTRATFWITKFQFVKAWELNKLSILVYPFIILVYFHILGRIWNKPIFMWIKKFY